VSLNFAVRPDRRRQGVGTQMVDKLVGKLSSHRRTALEVMTSDRNLAAHLFWRAQGFRCEGIDPTYYERDGDAGYCFAYRLPADAE
jgi:ribosomal-protein-alanine N-acetyltransferase